MYWNIRQKAEEETKQLRLKAEEEAKQQYLKQKAETEALQKQKAETEALQKQKAEMEALLKHEALLKQKVRVWVAIDLQVARTRPFCMQAKFGTAFW